MADIIRITEHHYVVVDQISAVDWTLQAGDDGQKVRVYLKSGQVIAIGIQLPAWNDIRKQLEKVFQVKP